MIYDFFVQFQLSKLKIQSIVLLNHIYSYLINFLNQKSLIIIRYSIFPSFIFDLKIFVIFRFIFINFRQRYKLQVTGLSIVHA